MIFGRNLLHFLGLPILTFSSQSSKRDKYDKFCFSPVCQVPSRSHSAWCGHQKRALINEKTQGDGAPLISQSCGTRNSDTSTVNFTLQGTITYPKGEKNIPGKLGVYQCISVFPSTFGFPYTPLNTNAWFT